MLDRAVGGPAPDRMMIRVDGAIVAGSAVSYRWLERGGARILVGIMTGSWTLPQARGLGCFTRIIEESVAETTRHGGALLIAFVTEDNPSFRRLRDAGAALFPTVYFEGQGAAIDPEGLAVEAVTLDSVLEATLFPRHSDARHWSVVYTPASWREQLIARARRSSAVRIGDDAYALLDRVENNNTTRLLALYPGSHEPGRLLLALAIESSRHAHRLVGFAGDASLAAAVKDAGLAGKPGYITAMVASVTALAEAIRPKTAWSGRHADLAAPTSPWFLGGFAFHGGDRM